MSLKLVPFEIKSRIWILQVKMGKPPKEYLLRSSLRPRRAIFVCLLLWGQILAGLGGNEPNSNSPQ